MELYKPTPDELLEKIKPLLDEHYDIHKSNLLLWNPDATETQRTIQNFLKAEPEWIEHAIKNDPALYTKPLGPALRAFKKQQEQNGLELYIKLDGEISTNASSAKREYRAISKDDMERLKQAVCQYPDPELDRYKKETIDTLDNYPPKISKNEEKNREVDRRLNFALVALHASLMEDVEVSGVFSRARDGKLTPEDKQKLTEAVENDPDLSSDNKINAKEAVKSDELSPQAYWDMVAELLTYPGLKAMAWHKKAHEEYEKGNTTEARRISEGVKSVTGIDIHPGATIGQNFFIDHGNGVVIGETAEIGNNVFIYHGVTLGNRDFKSATAGERRHPKVGNNVVIANNASINGPITIGNGVTIGTNANIMGKNLYIGDDAKIGGYLDLRTSVPPGVTAMLTDEFGKYMGDYTDLLKQMSDHKKKAIEESRK